MKTATRTSRRKRTVGKAPSKRVKKTRGKAQPRGQWYEEFEAHLETIKTRLWQIAKQRLGKGVAWSDYAIAEWCGVSHQTVRNWRNGDVKDPRYSTVRRFCRGLGLKFTLVDPNAK